MSSEKFRVAIMASGDRTSGGGGSTAEKVARGTLEKDLAFQIGVVICNNPEGAVGVYPAIEKVNRDFALKGDNRIDVLHIGPDNFPRKDNEPRRRGQTLSESAEICRTLKEHGIDFVCMLGYSRILTGEFLERWAWQPQYAAGYRQGLYHPNARIMNDHPGVLPFTADTYGRYTHAKAVQLYRAGQLSHTAMTWHLAAPEVDGGPIIREEAVKIGPRDDADSLAGRVQSVEKRLTSEVISNHLILRSQHLSAIM